MTKNEAKKTIKKFLEQEKRETDLAFLDRTNHNKFLQIIQKAQKQNRRVAVITFDHNFLNVEKFF